MTPIPRLRAASGDDDIVDDVDETRFFAFFYDTEGYRSPMKEFLNRYMARNRNLQLQSEAELTRTFVGTVGFLCDAVGERALRPERAVNAAVVDSVMTGTARRLRRGPITDTVQFVELFDALLRNMEYRAAIIAKTSHESSVSTRLRLATEAFADVS